MPVFYQETLVLTAFASRLLIRRRFKCTSLSLYRPFGDIKFRPLYLFDHALLRCKQQICALDRIQAFDTKNFFFRAGIIAEIVKRCTFVTETSIRKICHFQKMQTSGIRKNTELVGIQAMHHKAVFRIC